MEEWYINQPEIGIDDFRRMQDEKKDKLEDKIKRDGEDQPGWPDQFDRYHFYVKYFVIRDGQIFDESRRYTKASGGLEEDFNFLDEMLNSFQGLIMELSDIASGYDNILVIEYGIQGKVIK